jgi:hypothetical protein
MQIKIKDIHPNPFRNIDHYPINREKVEVLKESMAQTTYWDNIVGRLNARGQFEQAFGHHRKLALAEHYGPNHQVEVVVRDLSDTLMIQMMARENMEEWSTSATVELETVSAVVKAFAEGKIQLKTPKQGTSLRIAPSFVPKTRTLLTEKCSYNATTVGEFLGWMKPAGDVQQKVHIALTALQYIEEGLIKASTFDGLKTTEIRAVVEQASQARETREFQAHMREEAAEARKKEAEEEARKEIAARELAAKRREQAEKARTDSERVRREREAKEADRRERDAAEARWRAEQERKQAEREAAERRQQARQETAAVTRAVVNHLKSGGGTRTANVAASRVIVDKADLPTPRLNRFLDQAMHEVGKCFDEKRDPLCEKLRGILEHKGELDQEQLEDAAKTLHALSLRVLDYAKAFEPGGSSARNVTSDRKALTR